MSRFLAIEADLPGVMIVPIGLSSTPGLRIKLPGLLFEPKTMISLFGNKSPGLIFISREIITS
jgi:hypothetical protein